MRSTVCPLHSEPVSNRLPKHSERISHPLISAPTSRSLSASPATISPLLDFSATGVLCHDADRSSVLSSFLGDDFVSSSMDVNSMTAEQLQLPLVIDGACYGVATTTFDIA